MSSEVAPEEGSEASDGAPSDSSPWLVVADLHAEAVRRREQHVAMMRSPQQRQARQRYRKSQRIVASGFLMVATVVSLLLGGFLTAGGFPALGVPGLVVGSAVIVSAAVRVTPLGRRSRWPTHLVRFGGGLALVYAGAAPMLLFAFLWKSMW